MIKYKKNGVSQYGELIKVNSNDRICLLHNTITEKKVIVSYDDIEL